MDAKINNTKRYIYHINKIILPIAFVFPALILFLIGETIGSIVRMYLIMVLLFLIGYPLIKQKNLELSEILIYSITVGIVLVALVTFIASFTRNIHVYFSSVFLLYCIALFGAFSLFKSRLFSYHFSIESIKKHLSTRLYFLIFIPIFLGVIHYSLIDILLVNSPLPIKTLTQKAPLPKTIKDNIITSIDEKVIIYKQNSSDLLYYIGKAEIIKKYGFPILNPIYVQSDNDPVYSSKYQFMSHYMVPMYWIGLSRMFGLTIIQSSKISAVIGYLIIFGAIYQISRLIGLSHNKSLLAGAMSIVWGKMIGFFSYLLKGGITGWAFSGSFYHNPPQLHSTAIAFVGLAMVITYYKNREKNLLYLSAFLIGWSSHFKPAFMTIIPFSLLLLFLFTKQYKFPEWYISGAILVVPLLMWVIPGYVFSLQPNPINAKFALFNRLLDDVLQESKTGIVLGFVKNTIIMVCSLGTILIAIIWSIWRSIKDKIKICDTNSVYTITAVSLFLLGLFEALCFYEPGERYHHGNFIWALSSAIGYCIPIIIAFYSYLKSKKLKFIVIILITLHLVSGSLYSLIYVTDMTNMNAIYSDDANGLLELGKVLDSNSRGICLYSPILSTWTEIYSGVPCSPLDTNIKFYPEYYSALICLDLDEILRKIEPDFIVWDVRKSQSESNKMVSSYYKFYKSKQWGLEIYLNKDKHPL